MNVIGIMFSGGLDSTYLLHRALHDTDATIVLFMFNDQSALYKAEMIVAGNICLHYSQKDPKFRERIKICRIDIFNTDAVEDSKGFIYGFKQVMLLSAMSHAPHYGVKEIQFGYVVDDFLRPYSKDIFLQFSVKLANLFSEVYNWPIRVIYPFENICKEDLAQDQKKAETEEGFPLELTYSCRKWGGEFNSFGWPRPCGDCRECNWRKEALSPSN